VIFLVTVVVVTFPTCWLVPGAETRLYVSIFPMVAPLMGVVVHRCYESIPPGLFEKLWRPFAIVITLLVAGVAVAGLATAWMDPAMSYLIQPPVLAIGTMIAAAAGVAVMWSAIRGKGPAQGRAAVLVVAGLCGHLYAGPLTTCRINKSADTAGDVALLKTQLPPGARLVSLGWTHHLFAYHYRDPIEMGVWPTSADDVDMDYPYFCFGGGSRNGGNRGAELPLGWEKIAEIHCERSITETPGSTVIVGRWSSQPTP
jgi:hypothetical protein